MKKILFSVSVFATILAASCAKDPISETNGQVLVRFHNTLGSKIEETKMEFDSTNMTVVGEIPAGQSTGYIAFDYFEVSYYPGAGSQFPNGFFEGKKDGVAFSGWSGNWCGTGLEYKQLDPGKYTIEIIEVGSNPLGPYLIRFAE